MKKAAAYTRRALWAVASDVGLFVTAAFFATGLLIAAPYIWWREHIDALGRFVIAPWGMALCLLRLERSQRLGEDAPVRMDLAVLFVLLLWVVVPFAYRFGNTINNAASWHNHAVVFFGVYAVITDMSAESREKMTDRTSVLFAAGSVVLSIALLWCAWGGKAYGEGDFIFGLKDGMYLSANSHYNMTGMMCVCCALMSLLCVCRTQSRPVRVMGLLGMALMSVVVVLTQSRTARYVLIAAYALGAYGYLSANLRSSRACKRYGAGLLAAALIALGGYVGADLLTDAALEHYKLLEQGRQASIVATAAADEPAENTETALVELKLQKREAADASFSGRTDIWKNLFKRWRENPKNLVIGFGVGRIGSQVLEGTIHEHLTGVSIHNAYLQYAADFGLIGFALLLVFFGMAAKHVVRAFFARGDAQKPGSRVLCMMIVAIALTGMMESVPLNMMSVMNIMLFFALALLVSGGRETCKSR